LLDLFGPWPGYVLVEITAVAITWALMTCPWTGNPAQGPDSPPSGTGRRNVTDPSSAPSHDRSTPMSDP
jgi:hypothetical protein